MVILRLQHSFQGTTGLPEDQYVNTFHFVASSLAAFEFDDLATAVKLFYSAAPAGQSLSIAHYMSGTSDEVGAKVKIYDLADAMPRTPLYEETYTPSGHGGSTGNPLPSELAICLSYAAPNIAGIPPPQLRGRIYLGPWSDVSLSGGGVNTPSTPDLGLRQIIVAAGHDLYADSITAGAPWSVYSPTRGAAAEISRLWCDDAWDIQRRRGEKPTSRVSVLVP